MLTNLCQQPALLRSPGPFRRSGFALLLFSLLFLRIGLPKRRWTANGDQGKAKQKRNTAAKPITPQSCSPSQVWNGLQCITTGAQQCPAGETRIDGSCHADCTSAAAGAQNVILELRSARQHRDQVCRQNPSGQECLVAESHYSLTLTEYENLLAGVPLECQAGLPAPISI